MDVIMINGNDEREGVFGRHFTTVKSVYNSNNSSFPSLTKREGKRLHSNRVPFSAFGTFSWNSKRDRSLTCRKTCPSTMMFGRREDTSYMFPEFGDAGIFEEACCCRSIWLLTMQPHNRIGISQNPTLNELASTRLH